jgi:hypothetical protein
LTPWEIDFAQKSCGLSLHYNRHLLEGLRVEFIDENGGGAG